MTTTHRNTKPFTIVVGVDYSELGTLALENAVEAARLHEGSCVHVIHVIGAAASAPPVGTVVAPDVTGESKQLRDHTEQLLARYAERRAGAGGPPFARLTTHIGLYKAAEAISQLASDVEADLVIVGTNGRRGLEHFLLGSVAEATVRLAPCPVLVVRPLGATVGVTVPKIEPACPRCLETRRDTDGKEFWCQQHRAHHGQAHTYHFNTNRSGHQSGLLLPM